MGVEVRLADRGIILSYENLAQAARMGAMPQVRESSPQARPVAYMPDVVAPHGEIEIVSVMQTKAERNWTAQIVIASAHAGLRPYCALLEAEIRRVLARVDDPRVVRAYLKYLREESQKWFFVASCTRD